jgi:hypothetical protein
MDFGSFLPPFFGVLSAFGLNYLYSWAKDLRTKGTLLKGIRAELEQARDRLRELQGKTVPMDSWRLAIHSGRALLLDHEILSRISKMYFAMDNYTYEIKLVRQFSEQARQAVGEEQQAKTSLASIRWNQSVEMQKNLAKAIDDLLKEDFWTPDC